MPRITQLISNRAQIRAQVFGIQNTPFILLSNISISSSELTNQWVSRPIALLETHIHTHTHTHTYIHTHKWRKEENKREGEKETGGEKRKRLVISKFTY